MKSQPPADAQTRLLDAAVDAFSELGFHATTTRNISVGAGMSPAAMYVHFPSKQHLLYAIAKAGHEAVIERLQAGVHSSKVPLEQLVAAIRGFTQWGLANHTRARVITYDMEALAAEHLREIAKLRRKGEGLVRRVVEAGIADGSFDVEDAQLATTTVMSLVIDLARWYREGKSWSREQIVAHYTACALRLVGAQPPRASAKTTGKTKRPRIAATASR